jgi:nitric oxide reductase
MVEAWFTPEKVKSMQPYIDKTVNDLLERMKNKGCANGPVDLVEEFALPVPSYVLPDQLRKEEIQS